MKTMGEKGAEVGAIAGVMVAGLGLARGVVIVATSFVEAVGPSLLLRAGLCGVIGAAAILAVAYHPAAGFPARFRKIAIGGAAAVVVLSLALPEVLSIAACSAAVAWVYATRAVELLPPDAPMPDRARFTFASIGTLLGVSVGSALVITLALNDIAYPASGEIFYVMLGSLAFSVLLMKAGFQRTKAEHLARTGG